jgi:phosphatidate cytidylyltransferase
MLKTRIITALVLLSLLLPALFASRPESFYLLTLVLIAAAGWEWARLNQVGGALAWLTGALCGVGGVAMWWLNWPAMRFSQLWLLAGSAWILLSAWSLHRGVGAWGGHARWLRWLCGVLALCLTWLALVQAKHMGVNFLLSVMALVWTADISAYFAGHDWGGRLIKRKLAASISPGKSWEGVMGAVVGVALLAFVWRYADQALGAGVPSLYSQLAQRGVAFMLLGCLLMVVMSVVGDLMESLVKRSAGAKDSSALLPGHGGVLDRVDALLPTLPLAMMLTAF